MPCCAQGVPPLPVLTEVPRDRLFRRVQWPVGRGVGDVLEERFVERGALLDHLYGVVGDRVGQVEARFRLDNVVVVPEALAEVVAAASGRHAEDAVEPALAGRGHVGPAGVCGVVAYVPLAGHGRPVAAGLKNLGNRHAVAAQEALVLARPRYSSDHVADAGLVRVQPGQKRRPGGTATSEVVHLREPDAALGQPVEVGRGNLGAVAAQVRKSHVVGQDEDDVGPFRGNRSASGRDRLLGLHSRAECTTPGDRSDLMGKPEPVLGLRGLFRTMGRTSLMPQDVERLISLARPVRGVTLRHAPIWRPPPRRLAAWRRPRTIGRGRLRRSP